MARLKPFLFEYSFDDGADEARQAEEDALRRAAEEEEANRPPTFTLEEFEAAKAQAHAQGRQEGMDDAMAGIEQQIARTLDTVFARLPKVFEEHAAWVREMEADAVRLAVTVMRKLAPEITRERELPEVEHIIREAFGFLTEQPKVMIRVAQDLDEPLKDKVHLMASRVGYEGQVVLVGDPELPLDDCRISWQAGAVERSLDDIWSQIDEIVNRGLTGQPERVHTPPKAAEEPVAEELTVDEDPPIEDASIEDASIEDASIEDASIEDSAEQDSAPEAGEMPDEGSVDPAPESDPAAIDDPAEQEGSPGAGSVDETVVAAPELAAESVADTDPQSASPDGDVDVPEAPEQTRA